jgi:cytochrome P450
MAAAFRRPANSLQRNKLLLKLTAGGRGPPDLNGAHMAQMDMKTVEHLGADYYQDPDSVHARLRAQRPVTPVIMPSGNPAWLVTGYADARAALADPRLRKRPPDWHPGPGSVVAPLQMHLLNSDPPDHERLRRLVNKVFNARRVERLRPRIASITAELLDDMSTQREVDLLASFAFPLAVTVICELIGVPAADRDDFRAWSATIVSNTVAPETFQADTAAMIHYFMTLLAAKRQDPADDLLSALIPAQDEGDRLSENELVAMAFLLLVAGHETTVNLIGNGMLALLLNPGELTRLRADMSLLPGSIEELLRHANPVNNATPRFPSSPVVIGGARIGPGEAVLVALSSANRDPSRYRDPERLDVGRDSLPHLAFGYGIHYCVGAQLARLEAEIAFGGLLSRFGSMTLAVPADSLRWRPSTVIHGLETLPVRLVPA